MLDPSDLLLFTGVSALLILAPGPDIVFLLSQAIGGGRRAGLETAAGLASGNLVHTLGAALGVSVIFRTSALAFQTLKIAGVIYLLYLAVKSVRNRRSALSCSAGRGCRSLFWRAFGMNVLNPKVALFFLAFLPQFAAPEAGAVWLQLLTLGLIFTALVVVLFGIIALCASYLHTALEKGGQRGREGFAWLTAALFAGLAARLAFVSRQT